MKNILKIKAFPAVLPPDLTIRVRLDRLDNRILSFELHSSVLKYTFAEFGSVTLNTSPCDKMQAIYSYLSTMAGKIPHDSDQRKYAEKRLCNLGNSLWDEFIPNEVKQEYWKIRNEVSSVLITSDEPWIPWEMIKPYRYENDLREDDIFWSQRFALSRWLSGYGPSDELVAGPVRAVAPEENSLPAIKEEISLLEKLLSLNPKFSILEPLKSRAELLDWLEQESFSILHFACHGMFDRTLPNDSSIKLSDGPLLSSDIQTQFSGERLRPLVFINACHGTRTGFSFTSLGGWASQLLKARVGIFIGAMWEVSDNLALEFAKSFYSYFCEDHFSAGEAFRKARNKIQLIAPYNSTWLAYVLYADPNIYVKNQGDDLGVQGLLIQLKKLIEAEADLGEDAKNDAFEQIGILHSYFINRTASISKRDCRRSIRLLKGVVVEFPENSVFAQPCNYLLHTVHELLGMHS